MLRLQRTVTQPIGLDLGAQSVRLMQVESVGQSLRVVAAARQILPENIGPAPEDHRSAALAEAVRLLAASGFRGRRVVAALPREVVHFKNLRLPMIPREELDSAVEIEARAIFPIDVASAQVRHIYAGEVRQGGDTRQEVIVLAVLNADIDRYLEQLASAGLEVESLDFEPAALFRCVERFVRRHEDEQSVHVLLDIGLRRSQLIIARGREISFYKPVEIGATQLNDAVARKLSISQSEAQALRHRLAETDSPEAAQQRDPVRQAVADASRSLLEDLGKEVMLCLRYHSVTFRGHRPQKLDIFGGEAANPYVCQALSAALGMPVEPGRPLNHIDVGHMPPGDRRGPLSGWATALGLALRRVAPRTAAQPAPAAAPLATPSIGEVVELPSHKSESAVATTTPTSAASMNAWRTAESPAAAAAPAIAPTPAPTEKAYA